MVKRFAPDIVILEVGKNDLVDFSPEVFSSEIESLVRQLIDSYSVQIVCICIGNHMISSAIWNK